MAKIKIVYGSTTGNTEWVASKLAEHCQAAGHSVECRPAQSVRAADFSNGQDLTMFGCSTWGTDEIELQEDFLPFYEQFASLNLKDHKTAVFGCGDSEYPYFCGAVDAISGRLKELGAEVADEQLKIDGDPEECGLEIQSWCFKVIRDI